MTHEPSPAQRQHILMVVEGLNEALSNAGIDIQTAAAASMLLAAEYAARSDERVKDLVEGFRRTLVDARKRARENDSSIVSDVEN